ncbi:MAG TPA: NYN domain-containing protein [Stenomitos sp.]
MQSNNSSNSKLIRIGIFYDGNYFAKVSEYYKQYDARKARLSIRGIHDFIREKIGEYENDGDFKYCRIVESHYFRGRFDAYNATPEQLKGDRIFDIVLMKEGIITHFLPIKKNQEDKAEEKGIDVWLALEAFELAVYKRFDVLALITGDGDYVPLIRKLNSLGTRVMLIAWRLTYPQTANKPPITTSYDLEQEATYSIIMNEEIKKNSDEKVINSLFMQPLETNPDNQR